MVAQGREDAYIHGAALSAVSIADADTVFDGGTISKSRNQQVCSQINGHQIGLGSGHVLLSELERDPQLFRRHRDS